MDGHDTEDGTPDSSYGMPLGNLAMILDKIFHNFANRFLFFL